MKKLMILCLLMIAFCSSCGGQPSTTVLTPATNTETTETDSGMQPDAEASPQSIADMPDESASVETFDSSVSAADSSAETAENDAVIQNTIAVEATSSASTTSTEPTAPITTQTSVAATDTASAAQEPYSQKTADTILTVTGSGVERDYYFSLANLQSLGNSVSADYFSRGKDPKEETNHFTGMRVDDLLGTVVPLADGAKKVTFTAADGYAVSYSISAMSKTYMDETDLSKTLYMILAWEQDGETLDFPRLVMGQTVAGDYNRTNWVRDVVTIEVKAG